MNIRSDCLKKFNLLYQFTGIYSDIIAVKSIIRDIFSFHPEFINEIRKHTSLNNITFDPCFDKWLEYPCIDKWLEYLDLRNDGHPHYPGDHFIYGYIKITKASAPPIEDLPITANASLYIEAIDVKMETPIPDEVKKFNSLYAYTGDVNDYVHVNHILFNLNLDLKLPFDEYESCDKDTIYKFKRWMIVRDIDDDPEVINKSNGAILRGSILRGYTKINKKLLRREMITTPVESKYP